MLFGRNEDSLKDVRATGEQKMSAADSEGITIILLNKYKFLHFADVQQCYAESLVFQAAKHCGISTAARHLFALRHENSSVWLSPCYVIKVEKGQRVKFEFRLRFLVPRIDGLRDVDYQAHDYFFHQVRSDFLNEVIAGVDESEEKILGLAVADMLRVVKETGASRDAVEKDYQKYVPSKLLTNFVSKYFKKAAIHSKLVEVYKSISVQDVSHIKGRYIQQIFELSAEYGYETYKAQIDEDGRAETVKLQVNPFHKDRPGLRIRLSGNKEDWQSLCSIEDLCFICMRQDTTVEISRRNGVPQYFKFETTKLMHSFVSLLDGYYRLMEKWTFNLCKDLPSPFLLKLRTLKCHGPVGKSFATKKLWDKRRNKPGCYILRESFRDDSYQLDVCTEEALIPETRVILHTPDGFKFKNTEQVFTSLQNLLSYYSEHNNGILKECIPPSEYDDSPLLLCKGQNLPHSLPDISFITEPLCIRNEDIIIGGSEFSGKFTAVYRGSWPRAPVECSNVAVKILRHDQDILKMKEFLHCANQCMFWKCETIVSMYGMILSGPIAFIMEYMALGPLDKYLHNNRSKIQEIDLVEAATYLTNAVWYLEEKKIVHGNIRCRNLLVSSHEENTFKVKLSDPGIISFTEDQIHWIPPECYSNYSLAKQSKAADIWALGTTLWEIFSFGARPLPNISHVELRILYREGARLSQPENCHDDIYKLMQDCWAKDPTNRKKPQSVLRDINQILYEVHNSRRMHTYASLNHQGGQSLASSTNSLNNVPTSLVTSADCDSRNRTSIGMSMVNNEVPKEILPQNGINLQPNLNGFGALPQLTTSQSNASFEWMSQWWVIEMNQLELGEKLGQGFYGEVRKAVLTRWSGVEEEVAVKQLKSTGQSTGHQDLVQEISIMKKLQHKNIVEIKGVVEDPRMLLVMEYVPLGSMKVYIQTEKERLSEKQLLKFAMDIAEGMEYLCLKSIVHRDLAARNILVASEDMVKISDFGLAQMTGHKNYYQLKTNRDLPVRWYAPETLRYWKFSSKSDVWSFGVTLWEMFTYGEEPILEDCKAAEMLETLESGKRLKCPSTCSMRIYTDIMRNCWEAEAKNRADFSQLLMVIKEFYENA